MRLVALLSLLAAPLAARAQEPIFVTPPVTMYQFGGVVGVDVERHGRVTAVSSEVAFGMLPPWTLSLHAVGVEHPRRIARVCARAPRDACAAPEA